MWSRRCWVAAQGIDRSGVQTGIERRARLDDLAAPKRPSGSLAAALRAASGHVVLLQDRPCST